MAGLVDVKFPEAKLKKIERMFKDYPRKVPLIMSRSINKTATSTRVQAAREISGEIVVNVSTIKKRIIKTRATFTNLLSEISVSRRRIRMIAFKARQTKKGVSYKIKRRGSRQTVKSAFVATARAGQAAETTGVFKRKGKSRLPIVQLRGPSLGRFFTESRAIVKKVESDSGKTLEKFIDQQIKFHLEKG